MQKSRYVLVTPARNEAAYIRKTVESVIGQTLLPERWVIVSDGSTDDTERIIADYQRSYPFVQLVSVRSDPERNFGSKVSAIKEGLKRLDALDYAYIGFLDADISFSFDYFEMLFAKFSQDPQLGVAGGTVHDKAESGFVEQFAALTSVAGAVQTFRRECFEGIGGYLPVRTGGIDTVAEVMARMKGWKTRSFPELKVLHYRPTGSHGAKSLFRIRFRQGRGDFCLGYHPLFYFCMGVRRFAEYPYAIGSLCRLAGYLHALLTVRTASVPQEFVTFLRREQMRRLLTLNVSGH